MLKEKLKNSKGITLIALIITVIVMLILVAVTVSIALNGGIFDQARTATKNTEKSAIYDQIVGAMILKKDGKIDAKATYDAVKKVLESEGKTVTALAEDGTFNVTGNRGTYTYTIAEEQIEQGESTNLPIIPNSPSGPQVPEVDLTGEYYYEYYDTVEIRITKNGDKYLYSDEETGISDAEMTIDKVNKTFTVQYQYEDSSSHKIVDDEKTFHYDLIEEDGEIVNKVLTLEHHSYSNKQIFYQNTKGFEVGPTEGSIIEGEYLYEYTYQGTTTKLRYVFNANNKTVVKEVSDDGGITWNYYYSNGPQPYFWYKGELFVKGSGQVNDYGIDFSEDTNSFTWDRILFTKIS